MAKQHKYRSEKSDFFDYSEGKMSEKDAHNLERLMQEDAFEADAFEGLSTLSKEDAEGDLSWISSKIRRRIRRNRRLVMYSAAAALISILAVTTIFINVDDGSMEKYNASPEMQELGSEKSEVAPKVDPVPEKGNEELSVSSIESTKREKEKTVASTGAENVKDDQINVSSQAPEPEAEKNSFQMELADMDEALEEDKAGKGEQASEMLVPEDEINVDGATEGIEKAEQGENNVYELSEDDIIIEIDEEDNENVSFMLAPSESPVVTAADSPVAEVLDPDKQRSEKGERSMFKKRTSSRARTTSDALMGGVAGVKVSSQDEIMIRGTVRSADNLEPLPGVNLLVDGSETGTISDLEGNFSFPANQVAGETIVASFIGMESEEFVAVEGMPLEIAMLPSDLMLDEVVVVNPSLTSETSDFSGVTEVKLNDISVYNYAEPTIGLKAYKKYIDSSLVDPGLDTLHRKQVVVLKFNVDQTGVLQNFNIIRSPSEKHSTEAIRVLKEGPPWIPATKDGEYINEIVRLRLVFAPLREN